MIPGEIRRQQLTGSRRGDGVKTLRQKNRNRTSPGKRNSTEEVRNAITADRIFQVSRQDTQQVISLRVSCYFFNRNTTQTNDYLHAAQRTAAELHVSAI